MAGVTSQHGSTFSGRNEVERGNIIQAGSITAGGNVNIGRRICSETQIRALTLPRCRVGPRDQMSPLASFELQGGQRQKSKASSWNLRMAPRTPKVSQLARGE